MRHQNDPYGRFAGVRRQGRVAGGCLATTASRAPRLSPVDSRPATEPGEKRGGLANGGCGLRVWGSVAQAVEQDTGAGARRGGGGGPDERG